MSLLNFFLSAGPIIFLIYVMTKKNGLPSHIALPLTGLLVLLIQLFYWGNPVLDISASLVASILSTFVPITIIFGAIFFNRFIEQSGAIVVIKSWLANITPNPTAQLMIIGWAFAFMIEGASGFGTPAAIAAPLLVSLGFRALPVALLALVMNSVPVSFGAVGTPTWYGFSQLNFDGAPANFGLILGFKTAFIHFIAALVVPVLALRFVVSWKEIRKNILFIYISIIACVIPYFGIALFNNEFPALIGGAIGLIISVLVASKNIGISNDFEPAECNLDTTQKQTYAKASNQEIFKAFLPFMLLIAILVLTRLPNLPFKRMLDNSDLLASFNLGFANLEITQSLTIKLQQIFGTGVSDSYKLLYTPALIPFVVIVLFCAPLYQPMRGKVSVIFKESVQAVTLTFVALYGAFVMVKLMMLTPTGGTSMVNTIGNVFASALGGQWVYFASLLGAIGTFFSGSNTVANLTFGSIQQSISQSIGVSTSTILALQSVGGAMGNMICLNNIIAVCTVVEIKNQEGYIVKRTVVPMLVYAVIAALTVSVGGIFAHDFWLGAGW